MLHDLILLAPIILLIGLLIHLWADFLGASDDLIPREFALFVATWPLAFALAAIVVRMLRLEGKSRASFCRCLLAIVLFVPIFLSLAWPAAEEWTIWHRKKNGVETDYSWNEMYSESGFADSTGFDAGWSGLWAEVIGPTLLGLGLAVVFLPVLALEGFIIAKVLPPSAEISELPAGHLPQ
jgi:hypothetical protein